MYYTLIGSRETPLEMIELGKQLALYLADKGYIVRSGGADGMDSCCDVVEGHQRNVYLPWSGFNGHKDGNGYSSKSRIKEKEATIIASRTHKNWNDCSKAAKTLHTRNVYQILGHTLDQPSDFVICWAIPLDMKGNVRGGTGTAVSLALKRNIPVFNLYHNSDIESIKACIDMLRGDK